MGEDGPLPGGGVDVGVDLSGGDVLVAEHVLNHTEVGAILDEVGGERVPESVRRNLLVDAGEHGLTLYDGEHRDTAEGLAEAVQKQGVIEFRGCRIRPDNQIIPDSGGSHIPHRDNALLVTFADDPHEGLVKIDTGYSQANGLGDTETTAIENLQDRTVALAGP